MRWFLTAGLCVGLLAVALVGCGPQGKVVVDNMVEWVNRQLGELDVKKAEIEQKVASAQEGLKSLRKARITAEVKIKTIEDEIAPINLAMEKTKEAMKSVRADLKEVQNTSTPIERGNEKYDLKRLEGIANDLVATYNKQLKEKERKERPKAALVKIHSAFTQKEADFSKKLDLMKEDLASIKDKVAEVKSFREAAASLGNADASIDENFTKLQDDMAEFKGKLEVVLKTESGEFEEATKSMEKVNEAEKYIETSTQSKTNPVSTLDDILGK